MSITKQFVLGLLVRGLPLWISYSLWISWISILADVAFEWISWISIFRQTPSIIRGNTV